MYPNEDEKIKSAKANAASQIAGHFEGMGDYDSKEVLEILVELERRAKELLAPHQKSLGIFDLDNYVLNQIAGAVLAAHRKVNEKTRGERKLTPEDIELVLREIKTEWEKK